MVAKRKRYKGETSTKQVLPLPKADFEEGGLLFETPSRARLNHEQRLKLAMTAMNKGSGMVYTQAVKLFNVKRSTLHDHMSNKCVKFTKGRYPLLSPIEERDLLQMLKNVQSKGHVITPYICRRAAFMYAKLCNYRLAMIGAGQMAGRKWFSAFLKRNNVTIRNSTNSTSGPTSSTAQKSQPKRKSKR